MTSASRAAGAESGSCWPRLRSARAGRRAASRASACCELANEARARARRCGSKSFAAAPPLTLAPKLTSAAREHAKDMARHSEFEHEGSDGSTPAERVTREGYAWRTVGENIASGPTTAEEVMEGWLASPGHCENLMDPRFTEMGIAYVVDARERIRRLLDAGVRDASPELKCRPGSIRRAAGVRYFAPEGPRRSCARVPGIRGEQRLSHIVQTDRLVDDQKIGRFNIALLLWSLPRDVRGRLRHLRHVVRRAGAGAPVGRAARRVRAWCSARACSACCSARRCSATSGTGSAAASPSSRAR